MAAPMDVDAADAVFDGAAAGPTFASAVEAKEKGNEFYKKKEYAQAIEHYTIAIDMAPNEAAYLNNRSAAYMMLGKYDEAARDSQSAVSLEPANAKFHHRAAKCYVSLWRLTDAQRHYAEVLRLDEANQEAHKESKNVEQLFALERNVNDSFSNQLFNNAISLLERALQHAPAASKLRLRQAEAHLHMNNLDQAEQIAVQILRANAGNIEALYWRGLVLQRRGEVENAIKHYQNALRLDPDHDASARQLKVARQLIRTKEEGTTAFKESRFEEAMAAYRRCLEIDPTNKLWNSKLHLNVAIVLSKLGDNKGALEACNTALALEEKYIKALTKRAQLYMLLEMYEEAVQDYNTLKELDPSSDEFRKALKNAQLELKKSKRVDYYKVLEISKDADEATIQKAYKRLARQWHPDRHQGDEAKEIADKKFKLIGEANQVLSDQRKRQQYDSGQDLEDGGGVDASEMFSQMFSGGGGGFPFAGFGGGFPGGGFPGGFGGGGFPGGGFSFGGPRRGHGHGHGRRSYDYDDDDDE
eukprot:m.226749 g.226749  ORF g.226749 m.226749 type:complete len:528 (+) comp11472_c0_seq1:10-1593(+)